MISDSDRQLISETQALLDQGHSVSQAASKMGFENANTLYQRIYRLGYKIERRSRLVPIHAQPIGDASTSQAA